MNINALWQIVFVVLKLTGVIDWSWWWVMSPLWINFLARTGMILYKEYK